jgi:retron-type reverse transcriptase
MKRSNIGIKDIATFENAENAYRKARKCKRYREEVLRFTDNLEEELYDLVADLEAGTYRQGEARRFVVYEPKKRDIYALPFRDRVAQHMINNKIEPIVERRFYYHSYACRTDKGMHKAADYAKECIRNLSFEGEQVYILKADIHKYFNSVDHEVLKQILGGIFKDKDLLKLLYYIIDSYGEDGRGLPVGNLLSQLFANLVLNELDNFVKHELKEDKYKRYMDDFAIAHNSREHLVEVLQKIDAFLGARLKLTLNPKTQIINAKNGFDFCGYRIYKDYRKIRKRSPKHIRATIKAYRSGKITKEKLLMKYASWEGHAKHADTYRLRMKIKGQIEAEIKKKELIGNGSITPDN